jgi:hypothetical protein
MNATSRESRSSLDTRTGHLAALASANAVASCGRRSSASAPLPVSTSTYSAMIAMLCVSVDHGCALCINSKAERCCCNVETR